MKLLPHPRFLERKPGWLALPDRATIAFDSSFPRDLVRAITGRLQSAAKEAGLALQATKLSDAATIQVVRSARRADPPSPEFHRLTIDPRKIVIECREPMAVRAAMATLRQLLREFGRRLPCLKIRDWPDFPRRGVMLDISRGRVPRLKTLLELADHLADFKINEFQLYTEHTFAYKKYKSVWGDWGALTGAEIRKLDAHCRKAGIELVPNQNSFGHLREWLKDPRLRKLAEVTEPWPDAGGAFLRYPSTLAPANPGTLPFLRGLYDELLPNFTSRRFNVGCDETWDLGRGQSKALCEKIGKGRVYLQFLKKIHRELSVRKKQMMFWGDIILHYPELVRELPRDVVALNWGYEASHPFAHEAGRFKRARIPFYVCPGTSTWMTLIGRHDNAFANLRQAAEAGRKHGAAGFLITDWGDGGHPQPLAVSYLPYIFGAAVAWCAATTDENLLVPVANREVFRDEASHAAQAALALGFVHRELNFFTPNLTPLGAVVAAPPPEQRELFCYQGLTCYSRISAKNIRAAITAIEKQLTVLRRSRPTMREAKTLRLELDLAARMALQSCQFMLWQQALAKGRNATARTIAKRAVLQLRQIEREFARYWPSRNKATPKKCSQFLRWRIDDYRRGVLPQRFQTG